MTVTAGAFGFLLTRHWRDTPQGVELGFWLHTEQGPRKVCIPHQRAVCFIPQSQQTQAQSVLANLSHWQLQPVALRGFTGEPVLACYFDQQRALRQASLKLREAGLDVFESDIKPSDRFLMERFVRGDMCCQGGSQEAGHWVAPAVSGGHSKPVFKVLSVDIETAMHDLTLYSIAVYGVHGDNVTRKVMMVAEQPVDGVDVFPNQRQLLLAFIQWLTCYDPDVIIGWNVINFDFWFLQRLAERLNVKLDIARGGESCHWRSMDDEGERRAYSVPGRVILDGIEVLKTAGYQFESFALNAVASDVLQQQKLLQSNDRGSQITELFLRDKAALAAYNLKDCELVWQIFERLSLLDFLLARSRLTGLPLDRIGGSVAAFDFRYLPLLHRAGFVAPNGHWRDDVEPSPGGFVMDSRPGMYRHVLVLDFKSLYPSIIRSFKIDPLGMALGLLEEREQSELVPGFKGAWFVKQGHVLPALIAELWRAREQAKKAKDSALSQAIKILMNSFYGVLGSPGCRFFDARLASSITRRGHQIIQQTAQHINQLRQSGMRYQVIYGDTDSVFVWLQGCNDAVTAMQQGQFLQQQLNRWWQQRLQREYGIESALEIEFETHFSRFFMPTIRGSQEGSKKRYAGVVGSGDQARLVFKGLETVRTDWTPLARNFQRELYRRIFFEQPYRDFIRAEVAALLAGKRDDQLYYRKRLRRKLDQYQRNIPPHVQAARKSGQRYRRGDWVRYRVTYNGAEPEGCVDSAVDYQHYIDRQLAPVADSILQFSGETLAAIIDRQLSFF